MPAQIVTETYPAPECNLSKKDVERFLDGLKKYMKLFESAFRRIDTSRNLLGYSLAISLVHLLVVAR